MSNPVARIRPLEPPFEPETQAALAQWMPKNAAVPPLALFRTLLHDRNLAAAMNEMGRFNLRYDPQRYSAIEPRDREIVIDRVCARCACEYEWGVHVASYAQKVGLNADQIKATVRGAGDDPAWSDRERLLIRLVDELHDTAHVSDALWAGLCEHWTESQCLQLLVLVGWYHVISYLANATGVPLESWAARFESVT
jgi:4-carboxymuconolactone decarboxylase